jgi:murein DD-endopeptidase MepM/ murein hydrolase activator NlpD
VPVRQRRREIVVVKSVLAVAVAVVALAAPATASAYGWPLKPFNRMHPIRGAFNDPRFHVAKDQTLTASFHFGVDISTPDGTPVYAVEPGRVARGSDWVSVRRPNRRAFGYWHVHAVVRSGEHVRMHQLLGYTSPGWGHLHFAESVAGNYRNPLRRGALTPFHDTTVPVVSSIETGLLEGHVLQALGGAVSGTIALVADAYDTPPVVPPAPWQQARLTPSLVRWRLIGPDGDPAPWHVAANLCCMLDPAVAYDSIFAPGTYQNKAWRPASYRFWLTQSLDTTKLPNGTYSVDVEASDLAGNVGSNELSLTVDNAG